MNSLLFFFAAMALAAPASSDTGVSVVTSTGGPRFAVNGEPFFVKGVTFSYAIQPESIGFHLDEAKKLGANTLRTWGAGEETRVLLDAAEERGLKVMLGLWLRHGRPGAEGVDHFNYIEDDAGKTRQLEEALRWVRIYKDHPALLCWGVGNEVVLNIESEAEKVAYARFLETVCRAIKEEDPGHPVASVSAWTLSWPYWQAHCPSIDVYGVNAYGPAAGAVQGEWEKLEKKIPYLITEFGPRPEWDAPYDANGLRIEPSDEEKYEQIADGWTSWVASGQDCLGGFVFNLGDDWNHTSVWLDMFMHGYRRPAYWAARKAFTGRGPANQHPSISTFVLRADRVRPGEWIDVTLDVSDTEDEPLDIEFYYNHREGTLVEKNRLRRLGYERGPASAFRIRAPEEPGLFKVYTFVSDSALNLSVAQRSLVTEGEPVPPASEVPSEPVKVEIVGDADSGFKLVRGGEPYLIKGVGGHQNLDVLKEVGGNSIRQWAIDSLVRYESGKRLIDRCYELDITVAAGIWIEHERHGFDYSDPKMLERQRRHVREAVLAFKDHPSLLLWGLGNEMEGSGDNPLVWRELNVLAGIIKELDPNHPVMTVVAGISAGKARAIQDHYPDIDILGVNAYAPAGGVGAVLTEAGWEKPYVLAEFGLSGPWEVSQTDWGAPIEPLMKNKAARYYITYKESMEQGNLYLGSYAFIWGSKQEATSSWFGMLLPTGEKLPTVDAMGRAWSGKWPSNRSPIVNAFHCDAALQRVPGGEVFTATVDFKDPDGDPVSFEWEVVEESADRRGGGDTEAAPRKHADAILKSGDDGSVSFRTPEKTGGYRLFVRLYDGRGAACIENIPFYVDR